MLSHRLLAGIVSSAKPTLPNLRHLGQSSRLFVCWKRSRGRFKTSGAPDLSLPGAFPVTCNKRLGPAPSLLTASSSSAATATAAALFGAGAAAAVPAVTSPCVAVATTPGARPSAAEGWKPTVCSFAGRQVLGVYHLTSASDPALRLWLARASTAPFGWRKAIGWASGANSASLQEVLLPQNVSEVEELALGGSMAVAVSSGRLLGVSLVPQSPGRGAAKIIQLEDVEAELLGSGVVPAADAQKHLSTSKALGVPEALERAAGMESQGQGEKERFVKVSAGLRHCAAISNYGVLYTWGRGGAWGAGSPLGHGDRRDRRHPTPVAQFISCGEFVVDVACGTATTCAVTSEALRLGLFLSKTPFPTGPASGQLANFGTCLWLAGASGSGRVWSSGAADYGVSGSGMLLSSKYFKELEFFRGHLAPAIIESQRRNEEEQLRALETIRKEVDQKGGANSVAGPLGIFTPFRTQGTSSQDASRASDGGGPAGLTIDSPPLKGFQRFPRLFCGAFHCGLLTVEGNVWLWGRNDCLQLSRQKPVMASGGESNYPVLAEIFSRSGVPLETCALGPCHSLAVTRSGAVYEWGGPEAEMPHPVDIHWDYPQSIFRSRVVKVAAGGLSRTSAFSCALTEKGEVFFWGPGVPKLPFGISSEDSKAPVLVAASFFGLDRGDKNGFMATQVVDVAAGPQGCLIATSVSPRSKAGGRS